MLQEWLNHLETLHPTTIDLGLERITEVAHRLHLLPFSCPIITVAGTNGKGSCVALCESILLAANYRVGAYFSPHLWRYNERVHLQGNEIDDKSLCDAFAQIEAARGNISLTYFEIGTLAALLIFKKAQVDIAILEVGMGGRLDAVNCVDPCVSIISTVALDHQEWLGNDRESIGKEKAGIMRLYIPIVCGDIDIPLSVKKQAAILSAPLYHQGHEFSYEAGKNVWHWHSGLMSLKNLPIPSIELQNAATALMALHLLPATFTLPRAAIVKGLKGVFLPGRFQTIEGAITRIFDVAHNPAAAALLSQQLRRKACKGRTHAVIAMLSDKDIKNTLKALLENIDYWHVAGLCVSRGGTAEKVADSLRTLGVQLVYEYPSVLDAYENACTQAKAGDRIVVLGSFHTVAAALTCEN
jgi:dihydrofolate synthase/folylpolyglutamate synthase